jgi:hypothetical protein
MDVTSTFASGNVVTFPNKHTIDFKNRILKVIQANQVVIVIPMKPPSVIDNENVFAFTPQGDFLWRISTKGTAFFPSTNPAECQFFDAKADLDGDIILYNWCSAAIRVNSNTGEILERIEIR